MKKSKIHKIEIMYQHFMSIFVSKSHLIYLQVTARKLPTVIQPVIDINRDINRLRIRAIGFFCVCLISYDILVQWINNRFYE